MRAFNSEERAGDLLDLEFYVQQLRGQIEATATYEQLFSS